MPNPSLQQAAELNVRPTRHHRRMSRQCTGEELREYVAYQRARSHTQDTVLRVAREVGVERSEVVGPQAIGSLVTFFQNIGQASSIAVSGQRFFTVRVASALLANPAFAADPDVSAMRDRVREYEGLFARADSRPQVTVAACSDAQWLLDGNKTQWRHFRTRRRSTASRTHCRCTSCHSQPSHWLGSRVRPNQRLQPTAVGRCAIMPGSNRRG